jgi:hypothetical protein
VTNTMPSVGSPPSLSDPGSTLCYMFPGPGVDSQVIHEECVTPVTGRVVVVHIQTGGNQEALTLCEVEVYAGMATQPTESSEARSCII